MKAFTLNRFPGNPVLLNRILGLSPAGFSFNWKALLKLRVVIGLPAAPFSSLAAEKVLSSPSLAVNRILGLSPAGFSFNWKALLKLRVVIGLPAAPFSSLAAEKVLSSPSLAVGRIFLLSFSAGVLKNRLGTGFYLGIFLIQPADFLYERIKNEAETGGRLWKKEFLY
nr:hypothetical protein FTX54_14595 [Alkalicoccus halolimnae]